MVVRVPRSSRYHIFGDESYRPKYLKSGTGLEANGDYSGFLVSSTDPVQGVVFPRCRRCSRQFNMSESIRPDYVGMILTIPTPRDRTPFCFPPSPIPLPFLLFLPHLLPLSSPALSYPFRSPNDLSSTARVSLHREAGTGRTIREVKEGAAKNRQRRVEETRRVLLLYCVRVSRRRRIYLRLGPRRSITAALRTAHFHTQSKTQ